MDNRILMVAVSAIIAVTITAGALVPIIADVSNNEGGGGTPVTYGEQGDLELGLFNGTGPVEMTLSADSTYDSDTESHVLEITISLNDGETYETISSTPNQIVFASQTCTLFISDGRGNLGFINTYGGNYDSNYGIGMTTLYISTENERYYADLGGDAFYINQDHIQEGEGPGWYVRPVCSFDGPDTGLVQRGIYNYKNGSAYIGESESLPVTFYAINSNEEFVTAQASVGSEVSVSIGDDWETATINYSYNNENGIVSDLVVTATVSNPATVIEYPATYILGLADHPTGGGEGGGSDVPSSITTVLSVIPLLVIVGIVLMVVGVYRKQ